jgi:transposase-like protein
MKYRKTEREAMKYPLELKTKVLKDYFDGVDGIRGLERTYGIQHQLILSWIKNCENPQKSLRQSKETKEACLHLHKPPTFQDPRKELEYLRTEIAYLRDAHSERISQGWVQKKDLQPTQSLRSKATK